MDLRSKVQQPPLLDQFEALVKLPSGEFHVPPNITSGWFWVPRQPPDPGGYEVRWYGRTQSHRRYEITRYKFDIEEPT